MSNTNSILKNYINDKYPIKQKIINNEKKIKCDESKNGILRGLVHKIGYVSNESNKDLFNKIINSGYLEIQFNSDDYNSGIFTRVLGKDDSIEEFYGKGIFLILSLSVLDDFDYWMNDLDVFGDRLTTSFYKKMCFECKGKFKSLENFSAVELGYLNLNNTSKRSQELVIPSDINIKRYVEAIYVSDENVFKELIQDESLELWIKSRLINKEDLKKVYRKNCTGSEPINLNKKTKEKIKNLLKIRNNNNDIIKVNYNSINLKRMISLEYKQDVYSENTYKFPLSV